MKTKNANLFGALACAGLLSGCGFEPVTLGDGEPEAGVGAAERAPVGNRGSAAVAGSGGEEPLESAGGGGAPANGPGSAAASGAGARAVAGAGGSGPAALDAGAAGAAGLSDSQPRPGPGGESGACTPDDDPDPDGVDTNCDGVDGVVDSDVYLSAEFGADTNPGTPLAPVGTLERALRLAQGRGGRVLAARGSYAVTSIGIDGAWAVYGGYPSDFVGRVNRELTVLAASGSTGLDIESADTIRLQSLTIAGADAPLGSSTSAYGLRAAVEHVYLRDVIVIAAAGGNGQPGQAGEAGSPGLAPSPDQLGATSPSCRGAQPPSYANGANCGAANAEGKPGGRVSGDVAIAPRAGSQGRNGTDGQNARVEPQLIDGLVRWGQGEPAWDDALPGYGGPGGAIREMLTCGGGGSGGCPGGPGTGGESGGGSIGILLLSGTLHASELEIRTGRGGHGGSGGEGGPGGPGGPGGVPECYPHPDLDLWCSGMSFPALCEEAADDPAAAACAHYGAEGGRGGQGGRGGGGVGGWTIGVVTTPVSCLIEETPTEYRLGEPGFGAAGNGGLRAPDGQRHQTYLISP